jgi:hypothetical protein
VGDIIRSICRGKRQFDRFNGFIGQEVFFYEITFASVIVEGNTNPSRNRLQKLNRRPYLGKQTKSIVDD